MKQKRERLIEFLNQRGVKMLNVKTKDIIEEFKACRNVDIPTSTAYRIIKQWKTLRRQVSDELLHVFQQ